MASVPWGGSELLWSGAAERLAAMGHEVHASVPAWPKRPNPVARLHDEFGICLWERPRARSLPRRLLNRARRIVTRTGDFDEDLQWLRRVKPRLLCISSGNATEGVSWMRLAKCAEVPYAIVAQAHAEFLWPDDAAADELRQLFSAARRCFFVSRANLSQFEMQIALVLTNADIVRSPFNVSRDTPATWPECINGTLRLACVGRLHPPSKGQDLLLQVLSSSEWRERPLCVSFYGVGPQEQSLRALARRNEIEDMVEFRGHTSDVQQVWRENHALILPSRYEGLPLAIIEALMCGRPAIVTDVAGNAEVVEDGVTGFVAEAPTVLHLNRALERAWEARRNWQSMGEKAYSAIRELVPADPTSVFVMRLLDLVCKKG
jgi:glycosyltransferase involved in cell wall biosynthesis